MKTRAIALLGLFAVTALFISGGAQPLIAEPGTVFNIAPGDVAGLIAAINKANADR